MKVLVLVALGVSLLFGSVDINSASKQELMTLKGIGDIKADAIIAYRKVDCFKSVESLTKIKGIGPKFIEKNKKDLTAAKCKI
jgi:competence protein ComEA